MPRSHHNRFFLRPEDIEKETFTFSAEEFRHFKVKRIAVGDIVTGIDGKGKEYRGEVYFLRSNMAVCHILETVEHTPPANKIILGLGIIKNTPLSFAIEKAVELGVWEIALTQTEHSERALSENEILRLRRIVVSALKQSGGFFLPEIQTFRGLKQSFDYYNDAKKYYADPAGANILQSADFTGKNIIMIGPEGGFSDSEIDFMREKGALPVSLGKSRLRAETAALTALAAIMLSINGK